MPGTVLNTLHTISCVNLTTTLCSRYNDDAYFQMELVRFRESERLSKLPRVTQLLSVAFPLHVK